MPDDVDEAIRSLGEEIVRLRNELRVMRAKLEQTEATATRCAQGLDEFEESLAETATTLDAMSRAEPSRQEIASTDAVGDTEPPPGEIDMEILVEWVHVNVGEWAERRLPRTQGGAGTFCWCAEWWEHPEAVTRLWVLRRAWLEAVVSPGSAMAAYFRDFFDPTVRALSDANGPFHACTAEKHTVDRKFLPTYPARMGLTGT